MKKEFNILILAELLTLIWLNLLFANEQTKIVTLKELIDQALQNNPEIYAAKKAWKAEETKKYYVQALPDPKVGFGLERIPSSSLDLGKAKMRMYQTSWMLPYPGKLKLKGKIASKQAKIAEANYKAKVHKIKTLVKKAYYELYFIDKAIEITKENKEIIKKFSKIAEVKYTLGKAPQQCVLKAQVELSKLVDRLITLNQRRQIVEVRLNTLLNRPIHIHVGKPEEFELHELVYTIDELYKLALHNNPELRAAYTSIEKAKTAYDLAKKHYYPDFMITAKYMDSKMDNGSWAIMGSVNVPLWYKKKQDYQVKEAQSILEAFEAAYEAKKNMVLFKIKDLLVKLQTLKRLVNLYKTSILPQAEQSLKASEIGYKTEKVDFLNLLDSQRMLFSFKLEYYRTIVNFKKYLAELEQTVGVELTKEGGRE